MNKVMPLLLALALCGSTAAIASPVQKETKSSAPVKTQIKKTHLKKACKNSVKKS
ncbi:MAG: hypothetical protein K2X27_24170 [Candidatus Obscuribacterales bacterium]|nr:hypothetical protein [Candidatus Obscuribacterales bacterium]